MLRIETDKGTEAELREGFLYLNGHDKGIGLECHVDDLEEAIDELHEKFVNE